jgi:hypothetical protein
MTCPRAILVLLIAGATFLVGGVVVLPTAHADEDGLNACGCRQGATPGLCYCEKKSHCGCPGECEPNGCEERRAKQMEKEIQVETKKAEDAARRQRPRDSDESSRGGDDDRGRNRASQGTNAAPPVMRKPKIVKMTPVQKRDLAKLIGAYLAEHPDQGGKAIEEVRGEISGR